MTSSIKPVKEIQVNLSEEELMLRNELEEILCELFYVLPEEGTQDYFEDQSIYDLADEKEFRRRERMDAERLNQGEPDVEELGELLERAVKYFKFPTKVHYPKEDTPKMVTGYVQILDGASFNTNGEISQKWKSLGIKVQILLSSMYEPERIIKEVESKGIEFNELIRVTFYGLPLHEIVGDRHYQKGEPKELVELSSDYSNILLAIPDTDSCAPMSMSNFDVIDELVRKEVQFGGDIGLDRVAMGHYEMTKQRLEELEMESKEESVNQFIAEREMKRAMRRNEFDGEFAEARSVIRSLNDGTTKVKDYEQSESRLIAQVIWLAEKKGERIENKFVYFQLKALLKKLNQAEVLSNEVSSSFDLVKRINQGEEVEIHLLDYFELEDIMNLLWKGGVRISKEYKETYFKLKERYQHLKHVESLRSA